MYCSLSSALFYVLRALVTRSEQSLMMAYSVRRPGTPHYITTRNRNQNLMKINRRKKRISPLKWVKKTMFYALYCVHTPFSQKATNSNTFNRSFIHSCIRSSQPQSELLLKNHWTKCGREKEMAGNRDGRSIKQERMSKSTEKSAKYSEEYWAYTLTQQQWRRRWQRWCRDG